MIGLLQRVTGASVDVGGKRIAEIGPGLLVLVGVRPQDTEDNAERLLHRVLGYRVFADADGRMNLDLAAIGGGLLLVPQFTLAADTRKGRRPGFSTAASPAQGERLFRHLVTCAKERLPGCQSGQFGADMQVGLVNDGPVTLWLEG